MHRINGSVESNDAQQLKRSTPSVTCVSMKGALAHSEIVSEYNSNM